MDSSRVHRRLLRQIGRKTACGRLAVRLLKKPCLKLQSLSPLLLPVNRVRLRRRCQVWLLSRLLWLVKLGLSRGKPRS